MPFSSLQHGCLSASPPREWLPWSRLESANSDIPCERGPTGDEAQSTFVDSKPRRKARSINGGCYQQIALRRPVSAGARIAQYCCRPPPHSQLWPADAPRQVDCCKARVQDEIVTGSAWTRFKVAIHKALSGRRALSEPPDRGRSVCTDPSLLGRASPEI